MSTLWIGNVAFEDRLDRSRSLSKVIQRFEAELAPCLIAATAPGDFIFVDKQWTPENWPQLTDLQLNDRRFLTAAELPEVRDDIECVVPWGWTEEIRQLCRRLRFPAIAPENQVIRMVNSRAFSQQLARQLNCGLEGEQEIASLSQLETSFSESPFRSGFVIKPEWGQSGRGQLHNQSPALSEQHRAWIEKRLNMGQRLFLEPRLAALAEFGLQWDIPATGAPKLLAITQLISNARGGYHQTCVRPVIEDSGEMARIEHFQFKAVEAIQQTGYFGPIGIDAMIFHLPEGLLGVRPLQDINARWTMGRLAVMWANRCFPDASNIKWTHQLDSPTEEAVATSAQQIEGFPVEHRTWCHT